MSKSRELARRLKGEVLRVLNENGGDLRGREVEEKLGERLQFNDWESFQYPNGDYRWVTIFYYGTIDLVKAGYIVKEKGRWYLTDDGQKAAETMTDEEIFNAAHKAYHEWKKTIGEIEEGDTTNEEGPAQNGIPYKDIKEMSSEDILNYMQKSNPYDFQNIVAALLRAMGYYIPFIAPKGKDGGIDIIAYSDPLGATKPILKVQVKRYNKDNPVTVDVVHSILGIALNDMAIVVTSGRFTEEAKRTARQYNVRLIDGEEFAELWVKYYNKMEEEDKALMPIEPLYFIRRQE